LKQDKADKIIKKAELKAKKAAQQVQAASKKAEAAKKKQELQAQKKAAKAADKATKKAAQKTKKAEAAANKAKLAAKKAEEKKAKAVAKAAAKAVGKAPNGKGGEDAASPPKKGKKKLLLIAVPVIAVAAAAGAFFFLRGDKEKDGPPEPIPAPAEYVLNEQHISALPVWGEAVVVYQEEIRPPAEDEAAGDEAKDAGEAEDGENTGDMEDSGDTKDTGNAEDTEEEGFQKILYRYEGLQSPVDLVSAYTALMTTSDAGFSTVDETLLRIDPPEFEGMARGAVQLARNVPAAEDGTGGGVHSLLLSWEGNTCSVTLDMPEGKVHDPAPEPAAPVVQRGLPDLEAMQPSQLGLPGDSMDAYEFMPKDGSVRINNSVCMRVDVYDGNNQIAGSYFLSNDGRLYKLDAAANAVVELDWE